MQLSFGCIDMTINNDMITQVERQLRLHFRRLPARYMADMCGKAEEVMIHRSLLLAVADCSQSHGHGHPQIHARFLKTFHLSFSSRFRSDTQVTNGILYTQCISTIVFGCIDKPRLLSQLSALVSEVGLNIREAHVYSTVDGFSLSVFLVDGWYKEEAGGLLKAIKEAIRSI
ncbi:serine/threonine-protein kinase STY8-like [Oryza brachyantha]|uniref:serine/threonine-protein kinase STY8-like n=1 Tax=Oryza brachyantha TaxID=4533 RepID=UPI001ADA7336|nr:serine/threonine-protein kinase STY8-like [Oryza brachyantha]